jgi:hypothetical protein
MSHIYRNLEEGFTTQDGKPIYLIVADETEEFDSALRYAAKTARADHAHVGVLHIMSEPDFQDWSRVEERVRAEAQAEGEKFLREVSARIYDIDQQNSVLFLSEGDKAEAILKVLQANPKITRLILGGDAAGRSPGPLVTYFSGKGMKQLPVPLTIVPGHIPPEKIDSLV